MQSYFSYHRPTSTQNHTQFTQFSRTKPESFTPGIQDFDQQCILGQAYDFLNLSLLGSNNRASDWSIYSSQSTMTLVWSNPPRLQVTAVLVWLQKKASDFTHMGWLWYDPKQSHCVLKPHICLLELLCQVLH